MREDAKPYTMDDVQAWVEMRWERERVDDRVMARIRATVEERDALRAQVERVRALVDDFECGHAPNDCPDDCPLAAVEQALVGR